MNKTFKVNYLSRDFGEIKQDLYKYARRYYPDTVNDLSEAGINTFLIEAVSYVGDILSFYLDYQTNETFLATAVESKNVLNLAKSLGYKSNFDSSATGKVALYILIPANTLFEPDYTKSPLIKKGTTLKSDRNRIYTTTEDVKIDSSLIGNEYVPARLNAFGNPTYFAVKVFVPVISGKLATTQLTINDYVPFNKVRIPTTGISEIIKVLDQDENEYYEVSNLTQNIVYKAVINSDVEPKYILKPVTAERRFVFLYEEGVNYLLFGAKQYKPDEDLSVNPIAEPSKFALNKYNNDHLADEMFEPNKLLNGDTYGVAPENTTLTITYRYNTTGDNNASIGEINAIDKILYEFDNTLITDSEKNTIISSIQVVNEEEIVGQNTQYSLEEIKDLSGQIYAAQNRAVTSKDYETLVYMMPQKYGSVKRVKAERDSDSLKNNINLYVACMNAEGKLTNSNTKIKENIKTWLSEYKLLTDTVDILDAKIINFGISYTLLVDPNADKMQVLSDVKDQLVYVYGFKPQIGESFNILDVYREIRKNKYVLDVKDLKIRNITDINYSPITFNINANLTSDGNMIKMPKNAIYEIKNPSNDIIGSAL